MTLIPELVALYIVLCVIAAVGIVLGLWGDQ